MGGANSGSPVLMHADKRYQPSLASELLRSRELGRGDVFETRKGVSRLGPNLALELGGNSEGFGRPLSSRLAISCETQTITRH